MLRISRAGASTGPVGSVMVAAGSVIAMAPRTDAECERRNAHGPAAIARPVRNGSWIDRLRSLVDAAVGGGAGLERVSLHPRKGGVERGLDLRPEQARLVVEVRRADAVIVRVEQDVSGREGLSGDPDDRLAHGTLDVFLGARDEAGVGRRSERYELVDVDADPVDVGGAGGLQNAVARLAG